MELKLCKIPMIRDTDENQAFPQHQPRKPNRFSVWVLHEPTQARLFEKAKWLWAFKTPS
ncbi:hypothetical protein [Helicobacter pylori]|uniref:hypothetical protein n=1 Tax=Helicobacter pylori TaxID=210 RepID=UPI0012B17EC2|nr:hypothetical protein [Helicobacter pylori]